MHPTADGYEIRVGVPTIEQYQYLRDICGLGAKSTQGSAIGLPNTWHGVMLFHADELVGMGRIIGDGGCFLQIVDVCVLPEHHGRGGGKAIMQALSDAIDARAPEGTYVSLIADGPAHHLYAKYGFAPTAPASIGMARLILR